MHEAEYLIRVAGRTIWLEKDTSAAISLLTDANQRLKELKDPKFLHVRKVIHQDIERLKLLPILNVEEIVLTLMALSEQIDKLPLALAYLPESNDEEDVLVVLNKSWQRFLADFITIRRRSASVEPLLTPVQKQNLMTNLKLKLGQAQWAASNGKESVYQQSLLETQTWLKTYFDMDSATNQQFSQSILNLTSERIFIEYPKELASLSAILSQI